MIEYSMSSSLSDYQRVFNPDIFGDIEKLASVDDWLTKEGLRPGGLLDKFFSRFRSTKGLQRAAKRRAQRAAEVVPEAVAKRNQKIFAQRRAQRAANKKQRTKFNRREARQSAREQLDKSNELIQKQQQAARNIPSQPAPARFEDIPGAQANAPAISPGQKNLPRQIPETPVPPPPPPASAATGGTPTPKADVPTPPQATPGGGGSASAGADPESPGFLRGAWNLAKNNPGQAAAIGGAAGIAGLGVGSMFGGSQPDQPSSFRNYPY